MGMGEVKLLSKFSFFMLVLNMAFLFLLLPKYKIIGAAWAYFLAVLPAVYLFYYVETKILKIEGIKLFYLKLYSKLFVNSLLFWAISLFLRTLITNFASLVVVGGCSVGLFLLTYKLLGFFETEDWNLYINFLKLIKNKLFYGTNLIKN